MMRAKTSRSVVVPVLGLWIILLFSTLAAAAQPLTVFGPKRYDKPAGSPVTYTDTFQAPVAAGSYTLWVQSGANGLNEVKNVSVAVNGLEVVDSGVLRGTNPSTRAISVQPNNTITVTLKGQGGNFITVKVLCDGCSPVRIDTPSDGATVNMPFRTVTGTLTTSSPETGVKVNGILAQVVGSTFVANHVPIAAGWNTITAEAVGPDGTRNQANIQVFGQSATQYVTLSADTENGLAPLEVTLTADMHLVNPVASVTLTPSGPTAPTVTAVSQSEYKAVMTTPGMYTYLLTVVDTQGNIMEDSIGISLLAREKVLSLLTNKWSAMKTALATGDIDSALRFFVSANQDQYRQRFLTLGARAASIFQNISDIKLESLRGPVANCGVIRIESGKSYSYPLTFVLDEDGIWKIMGF